MAPSRTYYSSAPPSHKKKKKTSIIVRLFKLCFVLSIITTGGYVGVWFYLARIVESHIEQALESFRVPESPVQLYYGAIHVSGFPYALDYTLHDVRITATIPSKARENTNYVAEIRPDMPVALHIPLFESAARLIPPAQLALTFNGVQRKYNWQLQGLEQSYLTYTLDNSKIPNFLVALFQTPDRWLEALNNVQYADQGLRLQDGNGTLLWSAKPNSMQLTRHISPQGVNFVLHAAFNAMQPEPALYAALFDGMTSPTPEYPNFSYYMQKTDEQTKATSAVLNMQFTALQAEGVLNQPKLAAHIQQFAIANAMYALNSDGDISLEAKDLMMPQGWYRLQLVNYPAFTKHYQQLVNALVDSGIAYYINSYTPLKLENISDDTLTRMTALLQQWGEQQEEQNSLVITLRRNDGETMMVGKTPWLDTIMQLNAAKEAAPKKVN